MLLMQGNIEIYKQLLSSSYAHFEQLALELEI